MLNRNINLRQYTLCSVLFFVLCPNPDPNLNPDHGSGMATTLPMVAAAVAAACAAILTPVGSYVLVGKGEIPVPPLYTNSSL